MDIIFFIGEKEMFRTKVQLIIYKKAENHHSKKNININIINQIYTKHKLDHIPPFRIHSSTLDKEIFMKVLKSRHFIKINFFLMETNEREGSDFSFSFTKFTFLKDFL